MNAKKVFVGLAKVIMVGCVLVGAPVVGIMITRARDAESAAAIPAVTAAKKAQPKAEGPKYPSDFVGVLLPPQMANLQPRGDGKILAVRAKLGQAVRAGDVLLQFDPREARESLAMAMAQLKTAQADAYAAGAEVAAARKRASRRNATVTVGGQAIPLVSGEEASQAQSDAQGAAGRAGAAAAKIGEQKARVEQLKLALEETEVRAPFDGLVTALNYEAGMTAHPGDIVARVVGGQGLRARIAVPEEAVDLLNRRRVRLSFEGKMLVAYIDQVAREVEPNSRSFIIEGTVDLGTAGCGGDCAMLAGRAVRATLLRDGER